MACVFSIHKLLYFGVFFTRMLHLYTRCVGILKSYKKSLWKQEGLECYNNEFADRTLAHSPLESCSVLDVGRWSTERSDTKFDMKQTTMKLIISYWPLCIRIIWSIIVHYTGHKRTTACRSILLFDVLLYTVRLFLLFLCCFFHLCKNKLTLFAWIVARLNNPNMWILIYQQFWRSVLQQKFDPKSFYSGEVAFKL